MSSHLSANEISKNRVGESSRVLEVFLASNSDVETIYVVRRQLKVANEIPGGLSALLWPKHCRLGDTMLIEG